MKKLRLLFSTLALLLCSNFASAHDFEVDGFYYNITSSTDLTVEVTYRGEGTLWYLDEYSGSVTIPASFSFKGKTYSVTSIGLCAFYGCSSLTYVTIPNSVTSIGEQAFDGCSGLKYVTIPNSVTSIGGAAFNGCSSLTSVTIPNSVTSIEWHTFRGCSSLTSVTIPNSVTSIGYAAFSGCSKLTTIKIPNSVTSIGDKAFYECSRLREVIIPDSVTSIGDYTFYKCSGLTSVTIPNSVTSIGDEAFYECSRLTSVTIPNSVTSIGKLVFEGCSDLTSVTIPNSVTSIGYRTFCDCSGLTSVRIEDGNEVYDSRDNCNAIIETATNSLIIGSNSTVIPNSVTSIGNWAFYKFSGLTSVAIPNSVTSIGWYAFRGCSGLTSVTIPNSVTSIGDEAFSSCPELTDVYCFAQKVPSTESDAFVGSYVEYATLHVPAGSVEAYAATAPWSGFGTIVGLSEKCETPSVVYKDGKLTLTSGTEGAEFITKVVADDAKTFYDAEIELSASYSIEVFALKSGCENSDTVNVTLCWIDQDGADEENGIINVPSVPVLVQSNGGILTLEGVPAGTDITVYTTSGTEIAKTIATGTTTSVSVGLSNGTVVIVKIGNRSVKVRLR